MMGTNHALPNEYLSRREIPADWPVSEVMLEALADAGVDHMTGNRTLNDALDPDALDRLFAGRNPERAVVSLDLWGKRILVTSDEVRVYDR